MDKQEMEMFGCLLEDLYMDVMEAHADPNYSVVGFAMSVLSNAQEEIERGLDNKARQSINIAKYIIKQIEEK
tara:strand:+ start:960 stop:1175 length:216 start_codon:yes stop_codon:yes gene_type:complete